MESYNIPMHIKKWFLNSSIGTFLLIIISISGCSDDNLEGRSRLRNHILVHENYLRDTYRNIYDQGMRRIEEQEAMGNFKLSYLKSTYAAVNDNLRHSLTAFEYLERLSEQARVDSLNLYSMAWSNLHRSFCKDFSTNDVRDLPALCSNSTQNPFTEILSLTKDEATLDWGMEEVLLRVGLVESAIDKITYLNSRMRIRTVMEDSLTLIAYPAEGIVEAGKEAKINLGVTIIQPIRPEFEGSGRIELHPNGQMATLHIPTSESMIPPGQQEAQVPFNAKIKVPKADGSMYLIPVSGSVTIRRPCKAPQ
jgi:hypothetical protein